MTNESRPGDSRVKEIESFHKEYSRIGAVLKKMKRYLRSLTWFTKVTVVHIGKRCFDLIVAASILAILSPLFLLGLILSGFSFDRVRRYGKDCSTYEELSFEAGGKRRGRLIRKLRLTNLPILINVIKGDMSLVGPRPMSPDEVDLKDRAMRRRHEVKPGLISPWWIRRRANIDYGSELSTDLEYVDKHGVLSDIGICLRTIPVLLLGESTPSPDDRLTILKIPIDNITMDKAVDTILKWLRENRSRQVCFVNADCANISYKNSDYLEVLKTADLCLADGIGLKLAGKLLSRTIAQNVNGTDMFPILCQQLAGTGLKVFLLGGRAEVVQGVADWINSNYAEVEVAGYHHGYFDRDDEPGIIKNIADSGAHLLLVAFGAPRQDIWINRHIVESGARVAIGVGGLFDFYSGRLPRAPLWMREIGLEWLYRMLQEPGRLWKRYLIGNFVFLFRVIKERLGQ